jgi:CheY-like chemotaxis protein
MAKGNSDTLVLVADDEPSTLALVAAHVRSKGFKVLEASDGDQAWQLAHEHLPDLVVLDVMMPGMSGWEVCRKIREAVSLAHTGVVMLTGIGENLNELTSPLYGADAYIDKPFEFSELDSKIRETLARRRKGALGRADSEDVDAGWDNGAAEAAAFISAPRRTSKKPAAPDGKSEAASPPSKKPKRAISARPPVKAKSRAQKKKATGRTRRTTASSKRKKKAAKKPTRAASSKSKKAAPRRPSASKVKKARARATPR